MGYLVSKEEMSAKIYKVLEKWLGKICPKIDIVSETANGI